MYSDMSICTRAFFVAEHELRQPLGQQGLADARRPGEDEAADGPLRILEPGPALAHGLGDGA